MSHNYTISFKSKLHEHKISILNNFWDRLCYVKQLVFEAKSKSKDEIGWNGKGYGEVLISKEKDTVLVFHEKGVWHNKQGKEINFSNVLRWTLDRYVGVISLEHLRHGIDHPIFLFHLTTLSKNSLSCVNPHLCKRDAYFGQIRFDPNGLQLHWRVIGPQKNEEINYDYT